MYCYWLKVRRHIGLAMLVNLLQSANIVLNSRGRAPAGLVDEFASYSVKVVSVTGDVSQATEAKRIVMSN